MESGKSMLEKRASNDFVVQIPNPEDSFVFNKEKNDSYTSVKDNFELEQFESLGVQVSTPIASPSPSIEITRISATPTKPPKVPTDKKLTPRNSIGISAFSKPKSRLVEPSHAVDPKMVEEKSTQMLNPSSSPFRSSPAAASPSNKATVTTPKENLRSVPVTPKTPLITPSVDEEDDEEVYKTAVLQLSQKSGKKWKILIWIEFVAFVCIMGLLIASLTVHKLENTKIWSLELWKWCVLVLVIFCGRLFTEWMMNVVIFLIEKNYLLKKKVLYFIFGLKRSVRVFVWLGLVLLAWGLLFDHGVKRSKRTRRILNYITRALASCLIGSAIWLVKTLFIKLLASSYLSTRFFDRIQESIFHQYIVQALSGRPVMEMEERVGRSTSIGQLSLKNLVKEKAGEKQEVIDVDKLKKMKQEKISAWTMKGLISVISGSGLSTIANYIEDADDEDQINEEITSEWEAKAAAYRIFKNVAKPGSKYIEEEDFLRFMKKEEVDNLLPLFEGTVEPGKIKRKNLKNWLVNVYLERKFLAHSLNDAKTAIEELNKLVSVLLFVVIIIVWLLMMGFLTTQILVFIGSQLVLVAFMFGNTAKTVFEAIIFVFVMHPFDVGDRCVVDGVQMIVEEMNILTTVFLRYDNEKIFYPNCILATKPISNFYRSPEMSDSVEFTVDLSTSEEQIDGLKARVKEYIDSKPQHWRPGHSIQFRDIENVNKMKMGLYVTHTINFQNFGDKASRRSELVFELKKIFKDLDITYQLLPQEVRVTYVGSAASAIQQPIR
ncbi:Mechanosensitive ion channel MscS [Corchorus olitorius]|uniref:Mechanosensitive ion channel protein n=1 Tax=Corchorus olitorius TaxID=93759 RepID=A0A1R3JA86_9ROSI|nr:Mechanosensitive ion channel MscS [Corchorus olitorius]